MGLWDYGLSTSFQHRARETRSESTREAARWRERDRAFLWERHALSGSLVCLRERTTGMKRNPLFCLCLLVASRRASVTLLELTVQIIRSLSVAAFLLCEGFAAYTSCRAPLLLCFCKLTQKEIAIRVFIASANNVQFTTHITQHTPHKAQEAPARPTKRANEKRVERKSHADLPEPESQTHHNHSTKPAARDEHSTSTASSAGSSRSTNNFSLQFFIHRFLVDSPPVRFSHPSTIPSLQAWRLFRAVPPKIRRPPERHARKVAPAFYIFSWYTSNRRTSLSYIAAYKLCMSMYI